MYTPPAFRDDDRASIHGTIRAARLATLVTATEAGLMATPLPLFLDETEGEWGTLYGHLARANPQWHTPAMGEAMAIFAGPDAYVSPSWYPSKAEHGKVVPTWNYVAVHAYGRAEFFDEPERLHEVVSRLTSMHEARRAVPWAVDDAPAPFVASQIKGIVGVRVTLSRVEGKRKLSQNRPAADRAGVAAGLGSSGDARDRDVAALIP